MNTKTQGKSTTPSSISYEPLLAKSKLFAKRCIEAKSLDMDIECQIWAALALELLGKASLAKIHPTLIVEVDKGNPNLLLEANGISTGTSVKTIGANDVYTRLKHTVEHFSTPVHAACKRLAERRNAELHSGDAACANIPYSSWEGEFWNASNLILQSMGMDLQGWIGADAKASRQVLDAYHQAEKTGANQRIQDHADEFKKLNFSKSKLLDLVKQSQESKIETTNFRYSYDHYWKAPCPSCNVYGVCGGDLEWEDDLDDQPASDFGYLWVERGYMTSEFYCPTCKLSLVGFDAINCAGIDQEHIEETEKELLYEPEYGND